MLAHIVADWQPLLRHLGRRRRVLETILSAGHPIGLSAGTLTIGFAADRLFHRELLEIPEYRATLEEELAWRFGLKLAVVSTFYPESRRRKVFDGAPA